VCYYYCATNDFEFESDKFIDVVYSAVLWRVLSHFCISRGVDDLALYCGMFLSPAVCCVCYSCVNFSMNLHTRL